MSVVTRDGNSILKELVEKRSQLRKVEQEWQLAEKHLMDLIQEVSNLKSELEEWILAQLPEIKNNET
jgi:hypothetical protein